MPGRHRASRAVTPQGRGRFGDFDVLDSVGEWDEVTARTVLARLSLPSELSFFTAEEAGLARPLVDLLLEQDDEPRIPVLELIDARLVAAETDGWHYDELPEDGAAWRISLRHLDDDARGTAPGSGFAHLTAAAQAGIVQSVQDLAGASGSWHGWPAEHVWNLWTRYVCTAFYSHPWAWNEIGFPGPAYPRGYVNPGLDARERWERPDLVDADPVPFARRVEAARHRHAGLVGREETGG